MLKKDLSNISRHHTLLTIMTIITLIFKTVLCEKSEQEYQKLDFIFKERRSLQQAFTIDNNLSIFNDSHFPEDLFIIRNESLFNYTFYPTSSKYSKVLLNTKTYGDTNYPIFTKIDFLTQEMQTNFDLNLISNLEKFLGKFYPTFTNPEALIYNLDYKNFINTNYKKKTIIIGIDGMVTACIDFSKYSAFKFLMQNGSYKLRMRGSIEAVSGTGWSTIFCSLNSEETGIINNKWRAPWKNENAKKSYPYFTPINGLDKPFSCVFDHLKKNKSNTDFENIFLSSWDFFHENFGSESYPNTFDIYLECLVSNYFFTTEYSNCDEISLERTKNFVLRQNEFLYFWYFSSLDVIGHGTNFCSTNYMAKFEEINKYLTEFFDYLKILNLLDKINFIVTTDHGADKNRKSHGSDGLDDNLFCPLFLMGPDFKKNYTIEKEISSEDIAPTIAYINNVEPHPYWLGKPLIEVLTNATDSYSSSAQVNKNNMNVQTVFMKDTFLHYKYILLIIFVCYIFIII